MPILVRASRTSSSLNGLMMAMIIFIGSISPSSNPAFARDPAAPTRPQGGPRTAPDAALESSSVPVPGNRPTALGNGARWISVGIVGVAPEGRREDVRPKIEQFAYKLGDRRHEATRS